MGAELGSLEWRHSGVLAGRALGVGRPRLGCGMEGFRGGTPDRVAVGRRGIARSLDSLYVARDGGPQDVGSPGRTGGWFGGIPWRCLQVALLRRQSSA